jgi:hypothetical protein
VALASIPSLMSPMYAGYASSLMFRIVCCHDNEGGCH